MSDFSELDAVLSRGKLAAIERPRLRLELARVMEVDHAVELAHCRVVENRQREALTDCSGDSGWSQ